MKILRLIFLTLLSAQLCAQIGDSYQGNATLLLMNPSFAGSNGGLRVQSTLAQQSNYVRSTFNSFDTYLSKIKAGLSVSIQTDNVIDGHLKWITKQSYLNLIYAQHFSTFKNRLKIIPSVQVSYYQFKLNPAYFILENPSVSENYFEQQGLDVSAGLLFQFRNSFTGGLKIRHIAQPQVGSESVYRFNPSALLHGAYTFHFSHKRLLQIMAYSPALHAASFNAGINATFVLNHFMAGIGSTQGFTTGLLGYRSDFFTLQCGLWFNRFTDLTFQKSFFQVYTSFNLRNKDQRRVLTNIENW